MCAKRGGRWFAESTENEFSVEVEERNGKLFCSSQEFPGNIGSVFFGITGRKGTKTFVFLNGQWSREREQRPFFCSSVVKGERCNSQEVLISVRGWE